MGKNYRNQSKTSATPRKPFEKECLDRELQIICKYGLNNFQKVWRVQFTLARIRKAARQLQTLDPKDSRRLFEGEALIRRMVCFGLLGETERKLDYVLGLTVDKMMERRTKFTRSMHQARTKIIQRHIRVDIRLVNTPSFLARVESEKLVNFTISLHHSYKADKEGQRERNSKFGCNKKMNDRFYLL